jgi:single-strand DNA-binding protein
MASINCFTVAGNLTRDVELSFTPGGTAVARYTIACNDVYHDDDGLRHETATFVPIVTFGKQAQNDVAYLVKGSTVAVMGRISSWSDPKTRTSGISLEGQRVQYLGRPRAKASDAEDKA